LCDKTKPSFHGEEFSDTTTIEIFQQKENMKFHEKQVREDPMKVVEIRVFTIVIYYKL